MSAHTDTAVIAIIGPTASGKSALALDLSEAVGGRILSADSMQVYRGMDVGTAKPTPAERARIPHDGIDLVDPTEPFTVARFVELADAVIARGRQVHQPIIVVGGTPLYYKSLFEGLFEGPPADDAVRARLRAQTGEELHRSLARVDLDAAARIHANDTKRLIRALEVHELTGRPISSFQNEWNDAAQPRHGAVWTGINWEREALNRRINARVREMIAAGWLEETRALLAKYGDLSHTAAEATGYAELAEVVRGRLTLDEAAEQIKIHTRQLARRQMKWFRRFPRVTWLRGEDGPEANLAAAKALLTPNSPPPPL